MPALATKRVSEARESHPVTWMAVALALIAFAAATYGPSLTLPFIGDDYVFLDKTGTATFPSLWSYRNTGFGWYRPWSRELHFWLVQRFAGLNEVVFRLAGITLWAAMLGLYAAVVRRLSGSRVAGVATLGVASLALWGTPLLWISGSQDLWMLLFAMATLWLFIGGRVFWSLLAFGLGLLSKETCAVLPLILGGYAVAVERRSVRTAIRRTAHLWALALVWFVAHPTLLERLVDPAWRRTLETEQRPSELMIFAKTILSNLNLDMVPHLVEVGGMDVIRLMLSTAALSLGMAALFRDRVPLEAVGTAGPHSRGLIRFAFWWMAVGSLPLFLPSIGWHAYYGCLGALGAWLAIALWLSDRRWIALSTIALLAILQWAHAHTPSWDWGNEWYQRRAGSMLNSIRSDLLRQHPELPPHSRVYFGHIPNNIGLVAGQSPAIRVWYRDQTLQAGFYSWYRSRATSDPPGMDFFFRFDSLAGLVEVRTAPEDPSAALATNPQWEFDHQALAMLFLRAADARGAAAEFEKLSALPRRADAAVFASVCWRAAGDSARADSLSLVARKQIGLSAGELMAWEDRLRQTMPSKPGR